MIIPNDIVDHIIDEVAEFRELTQGRNVSLQACSLVSKYFSFSSKRHLFEDITLSDGKQSRISDLYEILTASPSLSRNIQTLGLTLIPECELNSTPQSSRLCDVLKMLGAVKTLDLRFSSRDTRHSWLNLSSDTQAGLFTILSSPSVTLLSIDQFYEVPNAIIKCIAAIPEVHLHFISLLDDKRDNYNFPENDIPMERHIEKLKLHNFTLDFFFGRRTEYEVDDSGNMHAVTRILQQHGSHLSSFEYLDVDITQLLDLSTLPRLREIKLYTLDSSQKSTWLLYLHRVFDTASENNMIEEITFVVGSSQCSSDNTQLILLDGLLTGSRFTQLKKIQLQIDSQHVKPTGSEITNVFKAMPRLHREGSLHVELFN